MFNATAEKLARPALDDVTRNAFIESFAIHARILMAFLYEEGLIDPDDVLARHFFSDPSTWFDERKTKKIKKPVAFNINSRVGKEVAHLSSKCQQVTPEMKKWYITAIQNAINATMKTFLACVPPELLGDRWQEPEMQKLRHIAPAQNTHLHGQSILGTVGSTANPWSMITANTVAPGVVLRPPTPDKPQK